MYGLRNSELSTCLFQFSHKTRQTMLLYAYFTPKVDFKRKFNHHQSFLYEWRLTARTIRKYESNLESDVRFEIESNHEASQVPKNYYIILQRFDWLIALRTAFTFTAVIIIIRTASLSLDGRMRNNGCYSIIWESNLSNNQSCTLPSTAAADWITRYRPTQSHACSSRDGMVY